MRAQSRGTADIVGHHVGPVETPVVEQRRGDPALHADRDERLTDGTSLLRWSVAAGLLGDAEARMLGEGAMNEAAALDGLRRFREDLHAVLPAIAVGAVYSPAAWSRVAAELRDARARASLTAEGERFAWSIPPEPNGLDVVRRRAALAAERLLTGDELGRVRNCQRCSWLHVDRSPGQRRRWCSMSACGNRAKLQRHYERSQQGLP